MCVEEIGPSCGGYIEWRCLFLKSFVENLCHLYSDHSPVLVHCRGLQMVRGQRPFRFQATRVSHPEYNQVVRLTWVQCNHVVSMGLKEVQQDSKVFNAQTFGNILRHKRRLETQICDI